VTSLVELRDVFVVHASAEGGVAALSGLNLALEPGELCVVLGPSGSGKSTLARLVAGLERPSAGRVVVAGLDLGGASTTRLARHRSETTGYADQHYWRALSSELDAQELVALPLGLRGHDRASRLARARALLDRVGLADKATSRPHELSGGEQQRIALCAALVHEPALLIADEPTGELDAISGRVVYQLLGELVREQGAAALVVSHDPASTSIADRVVHVRDGRVSEEELDERSTVVIGRGGWLRVPEQTLRAAGIGDRATVHLAEGAVELRPVGRAPGEKQETRAAFVGATGVAVEARGLTRRYGNEIVLAGLDARFESGALTVVTGPSGSGKSTLLALLAGLDLPDAGEASVGEIIVSELDRDARASLRRELIGVVGQTATLHGFLTACENVELALALRGLDRAVRGKALETLAIVGLAEQASRRVDRLSAGERERVALARAVAFGPSVLIADEPTARLDTVTTLAIGGLLADLAHDRGTTVICATHDLLLIGLADAELALVPRLAAVRR